MSISVQYYFGTYHFGTSDFGTWPLWNSKGVAITLSSYCCYWQMKTASINFGPYLSVRCLWFHLVTIANVRCRHFFLTNDKTTIILINQTMPVTQACSQPFTVMDVNCRWSPNWRGYRTHCFTRFLRAITASVIILSKVKDTAYRRLRGLRWPRMLTGV